MDIEESSLSHVQSERAITLLREIRDLLAAKPRTRSSPVAWMVRHNPDLARPWHRIYLTEQGALDRAEYWMAGGHAKAIVLPLYAEEP